MSAFLVGCRDSPEMSSGDLQSLLDAAHHEDDLYVSGTREAATLPALMSEVDNHVVRMSSVLGDMRAEMGKMMRHCADTQPLQDGREMMATELSSHAATMHRERDVAAARLEVGRHVDVMEGMIDELSLIFADTSCH